MPANWDSWSSCCRFLPFSWSFCVHLTRPALLAHVSLLALAAVRDRKWIAVLPFAESRRRVRRLLNRVFPIPVFPFYSNAWISATLSPLSRIWPRKLSVPIQHDLSSAQKRAQKVCIPSSLLPPFGPSCGLGSCFVLCLTSTASSMTRFMNSSKPRILPSIRMPSCS